VTFSITMAVATEVNFNSPAISLSYLGTGLPTSEETCKRVGIVHTSLVTSRHYLVSIRAPTSSWTLFLPLDAPFRRSGVLHSIRM
jgi:hypothetical protein